MQPNKAPARWRDCIDPMTLPLRRVHIVEVLGYPHAANQVFYCRAQWDGQTGYCYLKYAAHADANLRNEVRILQQLAHSALLRPRRLPLCQPALAGWADLRRAGF